MSKNGLFVGLATLDCIYQVSQYPHQNQKTVATDYIMTAGGPATNAAVTFQHLNSTGKTQLLALLGNHPMTQLIQTDLTQQNIEIVDLDPNHSQALPVSSIIVTASTGDRAVVSINATRTQIKPDLIPEKILAEIDIVLIDGHQMLVGAELAQQAQQKGIPVVIDGGSWKSGFETVLPFINYAICSSNFHPPNCHDKTAVFEYLETFNIPHIAITQGDEPILYRSQNHAGIIEVHAIPAVDTLGAGDIFHGAFCSAILDRNFRDALIFAAQIATQSCHFFGTRAWMNEI